MPRLSFQTIVSQQVDVISQKDLEIGCLKKTISELELRVKSRDEQNSSLNTQLIASQQTISNIHDLIDACPTALPRQKTVKDRWGSEEKHDIDILVRLGSWLGATKLT